MGLLLCIGCDCNGLSPVCSAGICKIPLRPRHLRTSAMRALRDTVLAVVHQRWTAQESQDYNEQLQSRCRATEPYLRLLDCPIACHARHEGALGAQVLHHAPREVFRPARGPGGAVAAQERLAHRRRGVQVHVQVWTLRVAAQTLRQWQRTLFTNQCGASDPAE